VLVITELSIVAGVYLSTRLMRSLRTGPKTALATPALVTAETTQSFTQHNQQIAVSSTALASTSIGYFFYPPLTLLNIGLISYNAVPMLDRAGYTLAHEGRFKNDSVAALISLLCIGTGAYFAAALHSLIYHLSCRFIDEAKQTTTELAIEAYKQQPTQVWIIQDQLEIAIDLTELQVGDRIIVKTGDVIPIDGEIAEGVALIDQQALTGESAPSEKHPGDKVMASSIVLSGEIYIEATLSGIETQAHKLNDILVQTRDFKSQIQLRGEEWADNIAFPLLLTSGLAIPFIGISPATALLFSAPLNSVRAMLALHTTTHLKWATEHQVFIKDGRALEQLPMIDTVLFDKTGTLTETQPQVAQVISCGEFSPNDLLRYAAAAEQHLQHPIADALRNKATELKLELPLSVQAGEYQIGLGVSVRIEGYRVHVGSQRYITDVTGQQQLPSSLSRLLKRDSGHTFIFIAIERRIEGVVELYPQVRPEAQALIARLRLRGVRQIGVVSGDQRAPTEQLAHSLGINTIYAEVLPHQKAELIFRLQRQGHRVCYVGDGLNDAIAMKQANVSVCLNSAADATRDMAQVILLEDDLSHLRDAFDVADHLTLRLAGSLGSWIGFGVLNGISVPLFGFGPFQSSLLYAGAYGLAYQHAKSPTWLELLRKEEADAFNNIYEGVVKPAPPPATPKKPPINAEWEYVPT